jgi:hypothetical protein
MIIKMKTLVSLCFLLLVNLSSFAQKLKVGVSTAVINPKTGAYIAGDKQNRKFTDIHDNLHAKAVVISSGNENIVLLTLDCIGLLYPDVLKIRKKVAEISNLNTERIIVSSTHTHSGPDVVGIWGKDYSESGVDETYINFLIETAAKQIKKAFESQKNANIYTAEITFGETWVENICKEEIDRSVSIIHFKDSQNKAIATLTNFACHPTFMDAVSSEVSADFIHGYYEELTKTIGGEVLYLQGAIGGWVQPEKETKSFENAYKRGGELANAVNIALKSGKKMKSNAITFKSKVINIPVENEGWKQLAAIGTIKRNITEKVETEIAYFKIGNAQFVTHPGETAPFYSLASKKLMNTGPKFILGLGNDALGYILKPSYFEDKTLPHAEYLTSMSVGKQAGPLIMTAIEDLISIKEE